MVKATIFCKLRFIWRWGRNSDLVEKNTFNKPKQRYGHPYAPQSALIKEGFEPLLLNWARQLDTILSWQKEGLISGGSISKSSESNCFTTPWFITGVMNLKVIKSKKSPLVPFRKKVKKSQLIGAYKSKKLKIQNK